MKGNCLPEEACATPEPSASFSIRTMYSPLTSVHVVLGPVLVGAEDQGFALHRALQELLGQGRALVGAVVLVAEQGDVLVEAERAQGDGELDAGLAGADDQQAGAGGAVRLRCGAGGGLCSGGVLGSGDWVPIATPGFPGW